MASMANLENEVQRRLGQVAQQIEDQVDQEIEKLQKLKVDDMQSIRDEIAKKRRARMELERRWKELVISTVSIRRFKNVI